MKTLLRKIEIQMKFGHLNVYFILSFMGASLWEQVFWPYTSIILVLPSFIYIYVFICKYTCIYTFVVISELSHEAL